MSEILRVEHLTTSYITERNLFGKPIKTVRAVNDVSFILEKGDFLGIVGESGCGKSTLAKSILQLVKPDSGSIFYDGKDLEKLTREELRLIRQKIQVVFQDPYASLNPRMTVREIIESPLRVYDIGTSEERAEKVKAICEATELREEYLDRYPHEFSGGQRQRIMIARALILEPEIVVFDEPVSALDVSVRAQVLNLLMDLKQKMNFTALFISHDLSVVKYICNKVAVMYLGNIVELGDKKQLYEKPKHPYTKALLSAIPIPEVKERKEKVILKGEIPSPLHVPQGCPFHTRCPLATGICSRQKPEWYAVSDTQGCACHLLSNTGYREAI